jgi:lipopolysaccharide/colanic/teichoic acid biosynthesis glycosyltransferase
MLVMKEKKANNVSGWTEPPSKPHISMSSGLRPKRYFRWKESMERMIAALLLIPGLPMIALFWTLVRLCSHGPGIYRQERVGKNAQPFIMYKLRTMRIDAEQGRGAVWSTANDPRVTRLGRILRKLHLDELPQLFNVVKGEMSLIGPRPERPEIVVNLAKQIPGYLDRLVVLPGVTGLAQINLPPDTTLDDVRRKLVLDKEYIEEAGLWFDLRILMSTLVRMLGLPGFFAMHLFHLHRGLPSIAHLVPAGPVEADSSDLVSTSQDIPHSHDLAATDQGHSKHQHKQRTSTKRHRETPLKPR